MKVTKRELKKIIKEELETVMDEGFLDFFKKDKGDEAPETAEPTSSASSGPPEPLGFKPKPGEPRSSVADELRRLQRQYWKAYEKKHEGDAESAQRRIHAIIGHKLSGGDGAINSVLGKAPPEDGGYPLQFAPDFIKSLRQILKNFDPQALSQAYAKSQSKARRDAENRKRAKDDQELSRRRGGPMGRVRRADGGLGK